MKITEKFRSRKDLTSHIIYFENEGPLEMSDVSAFIVGLLAQDTSREKLISAVRIQFPTADASTEVDEVITTLRQINLLSEPECGGI